MGEKIPKNPIREHNVIPKNQDPQICKNPQ